MILHSADEHPSWTGADIGIMVLNTRYPFALGNVANARSFNYPVRYIEVEGASIERLLYEADPTLLEPFISAAQQLEREGVKAITGACGFMALFQKQLQDAVNVPVFVSSLLQLPFMHALTGQAVGVVTADSRQLRADHFHGCGVSADIPVYTTGMEVYPAFSSSVLENAPRMDTSEVEKAAVDAATKLVTQHPKIGSVLLECSDLPPYACAIQQAIGRPVFDFTTMIDYVYATMNRRVFL